MTPIKRLAVVCAAVLFPAAAQQSKPEPSVWDGIYTDQQSSRGETAYARNCASCHGDKLEGLGQTPPLTGEDFLSQWNGMTVGDLFDQVQATMPADRPGRLSPEQNAAIIAYILKSNRFPAGSAELPADAEKLKSIRFTAARPPR